MLLRGHGPAVASGVGGQVLYPPRKTGWDLHGAQLASDRSLAVQSGYPVYRNRDHSRSWPPCNGLLIQANSGINPGELA